MIYRAYINCTIAVEFKDDGELTLEDQAMDAFNEQCSLDVLHSTVKEIE